MEHCFKCSAGSDNLVYLCAPVVTSFLKCTSSSRLHYNHSVIELLCVPHHHTAIDFSVDSHCGSVTNPSNSVKNVANLGSPLYVGHGHDWVPTYRTDLVILTHHLIETSCNRLCQFLSASPESNVHELAHFHLRLPSAIGLM